MKYTLLIAAFFLSTSTALHAEDAKTINGWYYIDSSTKNFMYAKNGSAELKKGRREMIIQYTPTNINSDKTVYFVRLTISERECKEGVGQVKYYKLSGQPDGTADYVKGGSSLASISSDLLCQVDFSK